MNRLDVGRAIHSYRPPEEKAVFDVETPLGRARIIHGHWHSQPGGYKAFVSGRAVEPCGFPSYELAQQALRTYLERRKTEQISLLRKRLRLDKEALRGLRLFEPNQLQ